FVTARDADERIVTMAAHGEFDRVRDHLARHERGFHPFVPHCDAVCDGDSAEFTRRTARFLHTALGGLCLAHQRDVARRGLVPARRNSDKGTVDVLLRQTHRVVERALTTAVRALSHVARWKPGFVKSRHRFRSPAASFYPSRATASCRRFIVAS